MSGQSKPEDDSPELRVGGWSVLGPGAAAALMRGGFDWIGLDQQHGFYDDAMVQEALRVLPASGVDVFVRVPGNSLSQIGRVLDAGARGVIVPMVETAEQAAAAARACRYPPDGARSWGPMFGFWGRADMTAEAANAHVVCAVMVETRTGLENIDAIAATPGLDMIYVGPFDLSLALGSDVATLIARGADGPLGTIVAACRTHGIAAGIYAGSVERSKQLIALGFTTVVVGSDADLLAAAGGLAKSQVAGDAAESTVRGRGYA